MSDLENVISNSKDVREVKRATAAKMAEDGFKPAYVCKILKVSAAFVSRWKILYKNRGAECLRSGYKGSKGYLGESQKAEIIKYIEKQEYMGVEELRDYIDGKYGVLYKSKQSYYDLLKSGGLSRHKTRKKNPGKDWNKVLVKREEIKKNKRA